MATENRSTPSIVKFTAGSRQSSTVASLTTQLPVVSIVAPTYNERMNIRPLVAAVTAAMGDTPFELIFVDDDSPDGTSLEIAAVAREGASVRGLRRVGRRGLASAVVEGAMSAHADIIGVIDADMQHDETLLPRMLEILRTTDTDIVVASRHVAGGSVGEWDATRQRMSVFATWASRLLIGESVSDPMSGFFMTRRAVFDGAIYDLSQQGYKILLDLLTSSPHPLKVAEVPYTFRDRQSGESKVDTMIVAEYAFLLIEKMTNGLIPPKFVLFSIVGGVGLLLHLTVLGVLVGNDVHFIYAQAAATCCAMALNYVLNNSITYRTERLRGLRFIRGFVVFCLVCSMGALANISIANLTIHEVNSWPLAGIAGAFMSSVFNFGVSTRFVWGRKRRAGAPVIVAAVPA